MAVATCLPGSRTSRCIVVALVLDLELDAGRKVDAAAQAARNVERAGGIAQSCQ